MTMSKGLLIVVSGLSKRAAFFYLRNLFHLSSKTDQQLFSKVTAAVLADFSFRGNMHICSRSEIKKDSRAVFKVQIFAKSIL